MVLDRRFHGLRELGDLEWLPGRDAITDMLRALNRVMRPFDGAAPVLRSLLAAAAAAADASDAAAAAAQPPASASSSSPPPPLLIDLAAGGGGPLVDLMARPGNLLPPGVTCLMTDLSPNQGAMRLAERRLPGRVRGVRTPVDATRVPRSLGIDNGIGIGSSGVGLGSGSSGVGIDSDGLNSAATTATSPPAVAVRCMFNALHHLDPPQVLAAMRDAQAAGHSFAAFEVVERHPLALLCMALCMPLLAALVAPLARSFSRKSSRSALLRLLYFTYVIPLVPLVVAVDGFLSCLRSYSPAELQELCDAVNGDGGAGGAGAAAAYRWRVGVGKRPFGGWAPFRLVWVEGRPVGGPTKTTK
jgi:hypothetical protein